MHILLVDDDDSILQLVSIHLQNAGYTVTKASEATAALAFVQGTIEVESELNKGSKFTVRLPKNLFSINEQ